MDDKRTLLAFLLVGLIFLVMPYYYDFMGLTPEPLQKGPSVEEALTATDAEVPTEELVEEPRAARPQSTAPIERAPVAADASFEETLTAPAEARSIVVTSSRHRLVFSTAGGALVSAQLLDYRRPDGRIVDLIPPGGYGLNLSLRSEADDRIIDLRDVHFEPDADSVGAGPGGEATLNLRADLGGGRVIERRVTVVDGEYGVRLEHRFRGWQDRLVYLHWDGGIALAERDASLDLQAMRVMTYFNDSLEEVQVDDDEDDRWVERGDVAWIGVRNKYFLTAIVTGDDARRRVEMTGRPLTRAPFREYEFAVGQRIDAPDQTWETVLYAGPLDLEQVRGYDERLSRALDLGFPVVRQIAEVLLTVFVAVHTFVPNYGWVIVLFGFVVKILVYPLTHKSYESAARMQELQPKLAKLREKYKNDNQRLSQETMKLYKDEGVNPIGGCLPMLLQMPIFIALYQVFSSTIELRQAPWILWIQDLSLPDEIDVAGFPLHVLPLLMATAMFFQSRMTMKDPKQAALVYVMPVVMVFIMWDFSSGLVLYWTVFNVLQIGQQYLTNHLRAKKEAASPPARR